MNSLRQLLNTFMDIINIFRDLMDVFSDLPGTLRYLLDCQKGPQSNWKYAQSIPKMSQEEWHDMAWHNEWISSRNKGCKDRIFVWSHCQFGLCTGCYSGKCQPNYVSMKDLKSVTSFRSVKNFPALCLLWSRLASISSPSTRESTQTVFTILQEHQQHHDASRPCIMTLYLNTDFWINDKGYRAAWKEVY